MLRGLAGAVAACLLLVALVSCCWAEVLFSDDFESSGIDGSRWVIFGGAVTKNETGEVIIWSDGWFVGGMYTVPTFDWPPPPGQCLYFKGMNRRSWTIPAGVCLAWVDGYPFGARFQAHYCKFVTPGTDETDIYYGHESTGTTHIGATDYAAWNYWKLCFDAAGRVDVYLRDIGGDWELRHTAYHPIASSLLLVLTGDGGGWGIWDSIEIGTEASTPVTDRSWSSIKLLYR